jgi:transposase InsO family protein
MSLARLVVTAVMVEGRTKAEVGRAYGVSPRWVYELCRRFAAEGETGLLPRTRRPHSSPHQTPVAIEDQIVVLRKALQDQGLDAGAHTIAHHLQQVHGTAPSPSTIWRILSRRGFVTPQPQKRPKSSFVRFEAQMPNERWQADITHVRLATGADVEVLNVVDDHSRLLLVCDARSITKAADVVESFHRAVAANGIPAEVLTDNGAVFTGAPRGGRSVFEVELADLGVRYVRSRTYHPQTCGKVERFHQTLKRWLAKQRPARDLEELQTQLDRFARYYNTVRPHRALGRLTPAAAYDDRPKAGPSRHRLAIPAHVRIRKDRVDRDGTITLRYRSRLHHIGLGRRYTGTRVLALVDDLRIRVITEEGELVRELTLDPSRDYQPQARSG